MLIITTILTILMYILFSTIFYDSSIVGVIGKTIGTFNLTTFGYVAYIDSIFLIFPIFSFYNNPKLKNKLDPYVGWLLLFISILILQSLFTSNGGFISNMIYKSIAPYIGTAGLLFLFFLTLVLSLTLINQKDLIDIINGFKLKNIQQELNKFSKELNIFLDKIYNKIFPKKKLYELEEINRPHKIKNTKKPRKKVTKKEVSNTSIPKSTPKIEEEVTSETQNNLQTSKPNTPKPNTQEETSPSQIEVTDNIEVTTKDSQNREKKSVVIVKELEENQELLKNLEMGSVEKPKNFILPKTEFLQNPKTSGTKVNEDEIDRKSRELIEKLKLFKIDGDIARTYTGPLVTTFEFKPAPHVKVSKILNLQDDLAMALSAETIRIQAPIPGKNVVGIEIPNDHFETIYLRDILESKLFKNSKSPLAVALGKDIVGNPFVTDIKKLPHLLIAGTTGSGKSVGINAMILSLLYRNDPDNLKLILIDPKMLEFSIYNDIPHLLTPVIIEPKKAIIALANLVKEMERRYQLMAKTKVKNIDNFNQRAKKNNEETMPFIVVVIDELADLMMTGGKEVEYSIARLAQMARAAGIHIIVATQRPSVDVVTGLIKANLPARLSYRVGQKIDSKVILDSMGAEALLGRGDALFTPPGATGLVRLHAPWNTEEEIEKIVEFLKEQQAPEYDESYFKTDSEQDSGDLPSNVELDPLYEKAKEVVLTDKKTSISYLQRKLQIGYNRSANIIEQLERMGVISEPNSKGSREIL